MNAIYCRVSTDLQAEIGYSIGDQIRTCHEHAAKLGLETSSSSEYIDDGYSGEYLERPALDRLRDDLHNKKIKNVIVYDPDRLSRNLTNQLLLADEIEKLNTKLYFVTGSYDASPEGRLFFSIRGAISAFEKAKIRERTLRGKRAKARSGKMIQKSRAYGYDWDDENSTYIVHQAEAAVVQMIYDLYLSKKVTIKDIAIFLRQQNITNQRDKPFTLSMIYRILTDEKYAGTKWSFNKYEKKISQYKRKKISRPQEDWIPIPITPIVTIDQFQKVRQILTENKRKSPRNTKHEYLLRNFLKCSVCGYSLSAHSKKHSSGKEYTWYKCNSGGSDKSLVPCGNPAISSLEIDEVVWKHLCTIIKNNKEQLLLVPQNSTASNAGQIKSIKNHQSELQKKQTTILRWFSEGMLTSNDAEKELNHLKKELQTLSESLIKLSSNPKSTAKIHPEEFFAAKSFIERRAIIEKLGWKFYIDHRVAPIKIRFKV
ncbi:MULTISPECIES: recombinase family protein [Pelosinus]|uniref:Resolvase domain-containing protein n=1 Tax=Pelosinus fermentans B4 TaxID=1149862 RepID=I9LCU3_9FIRM|nr:MULTISPECIES: recombinase family protein [Pelosinus]EIW18166.1 Resolvase domain-containing protein [Pelosinus fermentans B4]EIW24203.1 Resolvase domain-containing protein [Pelosinus fermentans A11]OAM94102.1 Resolvase domain-containing protein [Pelosinus fermentans DSM 17108]SDQ99921.1 Site-specific DNA recombinase [Pelosinus fermentans]